MVSTSQWFSFRQARHALRVPPGAVELLLDGAAATDAVIDGIAASLSGDNILLHRIPIDAKKMTASLAAICRLPVKTPTAKPTGVAAAKSAFFKHGDIGDAVFFGQIIRGR